MADQLNRVLDSLINALGEVLARMDPTLTIALNVLVILVIVGVFLAWLRREMRSQEWSRLTPDERRQRIYDILEEAWKFAEWLYSHIDAVSEPEKLEVAEQKRQAALKYAKHELAALGASWQDQRTIAQRLESVACNKKGGLRRYSRPAAEVNLGDATHH